LALEVVQAKAALAVLISFLDLDSQGIEIYFGYLLVWGFLKFV